MQIPDRLLRLLRDRAHRIAQRAPDFIIGTPDDPYMRRWHLTPRNPFFQVYLHHFTRSDDDRALHDHPWPSLSILLDGGLIEWRFMRPHLKAEAGYQRIPFYEGDVVYRPAALAHRIELCAGFYNSVDAGVEKEWFGPAVPAMTLFITGPKIRPWGFHCPGGWVPWEVFTRPGAPGEIGPGCG